MVDDQPQTENGDHGPGGESRLRAYLELVRLPNLFTAMADVAAGFLFTHLGLERGDGLTLGLLLVASTLLYAAGVVLNDLFDLEIDRRRRPERPLPSGRVPIRSARKLGWGLLPAGVISAWCAALAGADPRPGVVAVVLAGVVVAYNARLKPTLLGPPTMGACRALNLLLGMSLAPAGWGPPHLLAATAIGVYISGVTWFARNEATRSRRWPLAAAAVVVVAGMLLLEPLPRWTPQVVPLLRVEPQRWSLLLTVLAALVGLRLVRAIADPSPRRVQTAVQQGILSLIVLDAAICFVVQGLGPATLILLLLVPTTLLGRYFAST